MLGRMLGRRLGSLQGGLVLLSDGPGKGHVSTRRREVGIVTIVVADIVDVEVGSFNGSRDFRENFFSLG